MVDCYQQGVGIESAPLRDEVILFHPSSNKFCVLNRTSSFIWSELKSPRAVRRSSSDWARASAEWISIRHVPMWIRARRDRGSSAVRDTSHHGDERRGSAEGLPDDGGGNQCRRLLVDARRRKQELSAPPVGPYATPLRRLTKTSPRILSRGTRSRNVQMGSYTAPETKMVRGVAFRRDPAREERFSRRPSPQGHGERDRHVRPVAQAAHPHAHAQRDAKPRDRGAMHRRLPRHRVGTEDGAGSAVLGRNPAHADALQPPA